MRKSSIAGRILAGAAAGSINGLLGAGGGMVLIPMLTLLTDLREEEIFPASVAVIAPICLVSLAVTAVYGTIDLAASLPYLLGGALGGTAVGLWGKKIPVKWLHRILGILILWGGIRYLWSGS